MCINLVNELVHHRVLWNSVVEHRNARSKGSDSISIGRLVFYIFLAYMSNELNIFLFTTIQQQADW